MIEKKFATFIISLIGILTAGAFYFIFQLKFDYNFEKFFPTGNPELEYYLSYRDTFENDNDYLLIGLENHPSVFEKDFFSKVDKLTKQLKTLPDVVHVVSPTELQKPFYTPSGWIRLPVLHWKDSSRYAADSTFIFNDQKYLGNFFSADSHSVTILLKHTQIIPKNRADKLTDNVLHAIEMYDFDQYHIAGKAYAQGRYVIRMQKEFALFLSISVILVIFFLILTYRAVWAVIVPLSVVLLTVIWMLAIMNLTGKSLDVMLVLMPTILFVVGMSDVVHILSKYIEELRKGYEKTKALKVAFREVGLATLLTSLTTAVGFLTLMTASIQPIRDFGLYTAIGVFVAYILAFTLLPSILVFLPKPNIISDKKAHYKWQGFLKLGFGFIMRRQKAILLGSAILTAFALFGMSKIEINTYLLEDLPKDDPIKENFYFFDEHFGGSRPFEMAVWVKDSSRTLYDPQVLAELNKIDHYLKNTYKANNVISPSFLVKSLNQAYQGGQAHQFTLPQNPSVLNKIKGLIRKLEKRKEFTKITTTDHKLGRFSGRMGDIGSKITLHKNDVLHHFMQENINLKLIDYRLTGTSLLIDKNNEFLADNMIQGLAIAFMVIAVIAGLMFRSFRMVFITLIPNIIPLMLVAGIMGLFGINLKLSTSIIFTIAFGIAVDDTIHFISKLRIELNKGSSVLTALKNTYFSTGKAIIITSVILSGGFLILILSSFGGTFYTGLLVSLTLLFALLIDLTLLPVLVLIFYKK